MEVERREWNVESCTRLSAVHCRGGDSRARHCTGGKCGPMLKRQWPPSLSLRGRSAPVAISGRHFQFVQGADKNAPTDCVCSGGHCAAVGGFAALRMRRPLYGERAPCTEIFNRGSALVHLRILLMCHCEAPKGPWQSREGTCSSHGLPKKRTNRLRL